MQVELGDPAEHGWDGVGGQLVAERGLRAVAGVEPDGVTRLTQPAQQRGRLGLLAAGEGRVLKVTFTPTDRKVIENISREVVGRFYQIGMLVDSIEKHSRKVV